MGFFSFKTIQKTFNNVMHVVGDVLDPGSALAGLHSSQVFWNPGLVMQDGYSQKAEWARDWAKIQGWMTGGMPGAPQLPDMRRDREIFTNSSLTPRKIIYGTCRVSGQMAYVETSGASNEYLHLMVILAGHPVNGFGDILLDDKLISTYGTDAVAELFDGTQTTACASMITASVANATAINTSLTGNVVTGVARIGGISAVYNVFKGMTVTGANIPAGATVTYVGDTYIDISASATNTADAQSYTFTGVPQRWTNAHKLLGCAVMYLKLHYNSNNWKTGIPKITVVVHGKKVYDPRNGSTGYSINPALCVRDYMLLNEVSGGMGCAADEIDEASFITAANICDEQVVRSPDGTMFEARYQCNGTVSLEYPPAQIIESMMQSMVGTTVYTEGVWKLYAGAYKAPIATLDESWLAGGISFSAGASKSEKANTVTGSFVDLTDSWTVKNFPPVSSAAYIAQDNGEELSTLVNLQFTTSPTAAQRIAKIILERSRLGIKLTYPCNCKAFALEPGDTVQVNNAQLGWSNKIFRVLAWSFGTAGGINLTLQEDSPAIYNWVVGDITPLILNPPISLADPFKIATPTGLVLTETLYATQVVNVTKIRVSLAWDAGVAEQYILQVDGIDVAAIPGSANSFDFNDVELGTYDFGVIALNAFGKRSTAAMVNYTVLGKLLPPSPPQSISAMVDGAFVRVTITHNAEIDIASYALRQGATWDTGSDIGSLSYPHNTIIWQPDSAGDLQFWAMSTDTSGLTSLTATGSAIITIIAPVFPPGATISPEVIDNNILLRWTENAGGTYPVESYEIRRGINFDTAVVVGNVYANFAALFETAGGTYKYWIVARDTAGLYGVPISVYATINQPPDYILRDVRPLALTGSVTNCLIENSVMITNVNLTETVQQHFVNNSWSSPAAQISAGYPVYCQSGTATAQYVETVDYGTTIDSTKITLDLTRSTAAGTVALAVKIETSPDNSTWTVYSGVYTVFASNFRYVRFTFDFTTADGGIMTITDSMIRLDVKMITREYSISCAAGDSGGTSTDITGDFTDVQALQATPIGTTALLAVIDFTDVANPTAFKTLLYNTSGVRQTGTVSVTLRGV